MSLGDTNIQNKAIQTPPAKKEFHFAATVEHYAEVVYAATIQEAEEIYHRLKRPVPQSEPAVAEAAPVAPQEPAPAPAQGEEAVQ